MSNLAQAIHEELHPTGINLHFGLEGIFQIEVRHHDVVGQDEDGNDILEYTGSDHHESHNLVLNQGLDAIGSGPPASTNGNIINGIAVGTDNSAPTAGQTTLGAGVGYTTTLTTSTMTAVSTVAPYVMQNSYTFTFAVGGAVGNIAEIGCLMAGENATGRLFSRALIQVGGSPGTITLLNTDQLIVVYLLNTIMTADITGTFNVVIDGVSTAMGFTVRPMGMFNGTYSPFAGQKPKITGNNDGGSFPGWYTGIGAQTTFNAVTAQPSNGSGGQIWYNFTKTVSTYVAGSYSLTITYPMGTAHPITNLQYASFAFSNWFPFQLLMASSINLLTTQTFSWPITVTWANAS